MQDDVSIYVGDKKGVTGEVDWLIPGQRQLFRHNLVALIELH